MDFEGPIAAMRARGFSVHTALSDMLNPDGTFGSGGGNTESVWPCKRLAPEPESRRKVGAELNTGVASRFDENEVWEHDD